SGRTCQGGAADARGVRSRVDTLNKRLNNCAYSCSYEEWRQLGVFHERSQEPLGPRQSPQLSANRLAELVEGRRGKGWDPVVLDVEPRPVHWVEIGSVCGERLQLYPGGSLQVFLHHLTGVNDDLVPYDNDRAGDCVAELLKECGNGWAAEVAVVLQTAIMPAEPIPAGADRDGPDRGDAPVRV